MQESPSSNSKNTICHPGEVFNCINGSNFPDKGVALGDTHHRPLIATFIRIVSLFFFPPMEWTGFSHDFSLKCSTYVGCSFLSGAWNEPFLQPGHLEPVAGLI